MGYTKTHIRPVHQFTFVSLAFFLHLGNLNYRITRFTASWYFLLESHVFSTGEKERYILHSSKKIQCKPFYMKCKKGKTLLIYKLLFHIVCVIKSQHHLQHNCNGETKGKVAISFLPGCSISSPNDYVKVISLYSYVESTISSLIAYLFFFLRLLFQHIFPTTWNLQNIKFLLFHSYPI